MSTYFVFYTKHSVNGDENRTILVDSESTGRSKSCEAATREWMNRHAPGLAHWPILFRKDGDDRHDMEVKPELLGAYMKENYKKPPFAVFEDRDSMVAKWRELGYTCFQPAEGNF